MLAALVIEARQQSEGIPNTPAHMGKADGDGGTPTDNSPFTEAPTTAAATPNVTTAFPIEDGDAALYGRLQSVLNPRNN